MGSVCFDFDSTLIPAESLELVLAHVPDLPPDSCDAIAALTRAGMAGEIPFERSLRERLALAKPHREALRTVAAELAGSPSQGARALIAELRAQGHAVYVMSGGLHDLVLPVATALGVNPARVHGVRCRWSAEGRFEALDPEDGFRVSKVEGVRRAEIVMDCPSVVVGDGATDRALREAGLVQRFVAYTEHARREGVLHDADAIAASMLELRTCLAPFLRDAP